jgi:phosphoribosylglycinamide formyltransferase-1
MPKLSKRSRQRVEKLAKLAEALPELEVSGWDRLEESGRGAGHLRFFVRKKTVAYYLNDHHGDGIISLCVRCSFPDQADLIETDPDNFYLPAYIGHRGWVGMRMDRPRIHWPTLEELLVGSYRMQAPKTLVRQFDEL